MVCVVFFGSEGVGGMVRVEKAGRGLGDSDMISWSCRVVQAATRVGMSGGGLCPHLPCWSPILHYGGGSVGMGGRSTDLPHHGRCYDIVKTI